MLVAITRLVAMIYRHATVATIAISTATTFKAFNSTVVLTMGSTSTLATFATSVGTDTSVATFAATIAPTTGTTTAIT